MTEHIYDDNRINIPLGDPVVLHAYKFAINAHAGQVDKAGNAYINHPLAVARSVSGESPSRRMLMTVALLHDVVEDTPITIDEIRDEFGDDVADTVSPLTRPRNVTYAEYVRHITDNGDDVAIRVKTADLTQNMNISRLPAVSEADKNRVRKRYMPAYVKLVEALSV